MGSLSLSQRYDRGSGWQVDSQLGKRESCEGHPTSCWEGEVARRGFGEMADETELVS